MLCNSGDTHERHRSDCGVVSTVTLDVSSPGWSSSNGPKLGCQFRKEKSPYKAQS